MYESNKDIGGYSPFDLRGIYKNKLLEKLFRKGYDINVFRKDIYCFIIGRKRKMMKRDMI